MSIELVMPSNHLILCHPLLLLPSIFPSIRVFSNESALRIKWLKCWSFSFTFWNQNLSFWMCCSDSCTKDETSSTVYLFWFWVVLTLCCCVQAFSSCSKPGLFSSCGAWTYCGGFSCCRAQALGLMASVVAAQWSQFTAQSPHCLWDLPWPGIEPVFPTLTGGFLTTGPPAKPKDEAFNWSPELEKISTDPG